MTDYQIDSMVTITGDEYVAMQKDNAALRAELMAMYIQFNSFVCRCYADFSGERELRRGDVDNAHKWLTEFEDKTVMNEVRKINE